MNLTDEDIADIVHGAHARLNARTGDSYSDEPFNSLPAWHREMLEDRVRRIRVGQDPAQVQAAWVEVMKDEGWSWGPVKDLENKHHPNLVGWEDLCPDGRTKVMLAFRITYALTME